MLDASSDARHSIPALVSARGGGDSPPVLALATALRERGHDVHVLCDGDVAATVGPFDLPTIHSPRELEQSGFYDLLHLLRMTERGESIDAGMPDPLAAWAQACLEPALKAVKPLRPILVLSTLFCMNLADRLAAELGIGWVFVNPSFYFGDDARRPWEADFAGLGAGMFRHWCLPLARRASMVLHATDPEFDPPPASLPANHHYVGPLGVQAQPSRVETAFLAEPGDPWVLVTLSTLPQAGELALARAALEALADRAVRVLLTLAPGHARDALDAVPANTRLSGYLPHGVVLQRACLMIGHAGHGMVMRGLYHGVPMVLVPWGRDQPGVAARARAMGVAEVVPRSECRAQRMAQAIARVLGGSSYADAARRASERLQGETSTERAVSFIQQLL